MSGLRGHIYKRNANVAKFAFCTVPQFDVRSSEIFINCVFCYAIGKDDVFDRHLVILLHYTRVRQLKGSLALGLAVLQGSLALVLAVLKGSLALGLAVLQGSLALVLAVLKGSLTLGLAVLKGSLALGLAVLKGSLALGVAVLTGSLTMSLDVLIGSLTMGLAAVDSLTMGLATLRGSLIMGLAALRDSLTMDLAIGIAYNVLCIAAADATLQLLYKYGTIEALEGGRKWCFNWKRLGMHHAGLKYSLFYISSIYILWIVSEPAIRFEAPFLLHFQVYVDFSLDRY